MGRIFRVIAVLCFCLSLWWVALGFDHPFTHTAPTPLPAETTLAPMKVTRLTQLTVDEPTTTPVLPPTTSTAGCNRPSLPTGWTSCIQRSPASSLLLGWKPNCGYKNVDYSPAANSSSSIHADAILNDVVFEFHGDSTLREVVKLLIQYDNLKGTLEKKDANAGLRVPKIFARPLQNQHTVLFRFDHTAAHLREEFFDSNKMNVSKVEVDKIQQSIVSRRHVLVLSLGLHEAKFHEMEAPKGHIKNWQDDLVTPTEDYVVERLTGLAAKRDPNGNFVRFDTSSKRQVEVVVFFQQTAECGAMEVAKLDGFKKMAPYCGRINKAANEGNTLLERSFQGQYGPGSSIAHLSKDLAQHVLKKTHMLTPLNCHGAEPFLFDARKPFCTRDGIHLRTKFIRAKLDTLFNIVNTIC